MDYIRKYFSCSKTAFSAKILLRSTSTRSPAPEYRRRTVVELVAEGAIVSVRIVSRQLVHLGLNRRRFLDLAGDDNRKLPATIVARYPGHMVRVDDKKVGPIPDGGGWRVHGRGNVHANTVGRGEEGGACDALAADSEGTF